METTIRSLMFVPSKGVMLRKLNRFRAHAFIIDLEDSILDADKDNALMELCDYLKNEHTGVHYVRIDRRYFKQQIEALRDLKFEGYVIPKFEGREEDLAIKTCIRDKNVIALIETPFGLANVKEIVGLSWVSAVAFGAEDYTSTCSMDNSLEVLQFHKSRIVMFAKAYGKPVYDTPCFYLNDIDRAMADVGMAVSLGFDGKLAIHPKMVDLINEAYEKYDIAYMEDVIHKYEASGTAVLRIGDRIFERMHIERFKKTVQNLHQRKGG